eukprot:SAG31_NODE_44367_length_263_cov_0.628049_1_plen_70_part_10
MVSVVHNEQAHAKGPQVALYLYGRSLVPSQNRSSSRRCASILLASTATIHAPQTGEAAPSSQDIIIHMRS